ncbi:MAG: adenylosuccinate synthase [Bacteroidetes bacterium]|jgi:adenylosuccinate synthase|nr:adenylosuccinate synthase [Bacteroidota bacterium]
MKVDVLLGLQWGDEGKGKVVDVLTPRYDVIARFQGGPNAGHSLEFNDVKHVLHTIPSGIFRGDQINVIGNGVVIDPIIFKKEIEGIAQLNIDLTNNLFISKKAHLILPSHRILDEASEKAKGKTKIGSTLKGIGPTYMDKTGRNGLRVGDILTASFKEKYQTLIEKHETLLCQYSDFKYSLKDYEEGWFEGIEALKKFNIIDSEYYINDLINTQKTVLAEGAQGTLLDIDFGSYPYVTSSNTISAGACTGLGVAPNKIGEIFGIFKAYCTRVGSGPFPTELHDETGDKLRNMGHEYGATTGRPRRCGWLDLPALRYAVMINGVTQLVMTKADVLNEFETIKVCTKYRTPEGEKDIMPYCLETEIEPVFTELPGWNQEISSYRTLDEMPDALKSYINYIEMKVGVPVKILSVGPNRDQTIFK